MPLLLTINSPLPGNGGAAITAIEFEKNASGVWTSVGGLVPGTYNIDAVPGDDIRIRQVNIVNPSDPSDVKEVAVGATEVLLNPSFDTNSVWLPTDTVSGSPTAFTISGGNLIMTNRGVDFTHGAYQDIVLDASSSYDVGLTFSAASAGVRLKMEQGGIQSDILTGLTTPGTYTTVFNTGAVTNWRLILSTTAPGATATFNAVTVKKRP